MDAANEISSSFIQRTNNTPVRSHAGKLKISGPLTRNVISPYALVSVLSKLDIPAAILDAGKNICAVNPKFNSFFSVEEVKIIGKIISRTMYLKVVIVLEV